MIPSPGPTEKVCWHRIQEACQASSSLLALEDWLIAWSEDGFFEWLLCLLIEGSVLVDRRFLEGAVYSNTLDALERSADWREVTPKHLGQVPPGFFLIRLVA